MLLKITDAAKHLGIHPDTLRRWANSGKVKVAGYTPGKQRLFNLQDFSICSHVGCEVVVINATDAASYEEDLTRDVLEIITVFSARLYGSRSHQNKKIVQKLKEAADEVCR